MTEGAREISAETMLPHSDQKKDEVTALSDSVASLSHKPHPRGRGVAKWTGVHTEHALAGSHGKRYTRDELFAVYSGLQRFSALIVPHSAKIPLTLQKEGPRMGINDLSCSTWIWITSKGAHCLSLSQEEVKQRIESSGIQPNDYLLSMSAVRQCGIRGSDFLRVFEEQENAKKFNSRKAAKEAACAFGSAPMRKWVSDEWQRRCETLDCEEVFYLDSSDQIQGPFERKRIVQWWKRGCFPQNLRIQPSESEELFDIAHLLARWFSQEDVWCKGNCIETQFSRDDLVHQFLNGELESRSLIVPASLHDAKRPITALHMMVHWLPFSKMWLVKEGAETSSMTIAEAFSFWSQEYRTQSGWLKAKPEGWRCDVYIAIEHLMESYGFIE